MLRVDGLRLQHAVWELLFRTKQALQSSGKSPNAESRCLQTVKEACVRHGQTRATFDSFLLAPRNANGATEAYCDVKTQRCDLY